LVPDLDPKPWIQNPEFKLATPWIQNPEFKVAVPWIQNPEFKLATPWIQNLEFKLATPWIQNVDLGSKYLSHDLKSFPDWKWDSGVGGNMRSNRVYDDRGVCSAARATFNPKP